MRAAHGHIAVDGQVVADTQQCPHCGMHFVMRQGSGVERGFCLKCYGVTCGKPKCMRECVPMEQWLELIERGQH